MAVVTPDRGAPPDDRGSRRRRRWTARDHIVAAVLFAGFLVAYLPFRADFLVNWDSVNYALGIEHFDLEHHQPHPPGYLGYVALGRVFAFVADDVNAGLTLLSATTGAAAPVLLYGLAQRLTTRRGALIAAVLFATSPLVAYYSLVALTYLPEAVVALAFAWTAHAARTERSWRALAAASLLLAVAGALRQTTLVLLLPLWAWAMWPFPWRHRAQAAVVAGLGVLAWLVPLLVLAGGLGRYLELSSDLASLAGGQTWALSLNLGGLATNLQYVVVGLVIGLHVAVVVAALVSWSRRRAAAAGEGIGGSAPRAASSWVATTSRADRTFAALWVLPALTTFVFVHTGQLGYVLLVLPLGFLWCGAVLDRWLLRRPTSPRVAHLPAVAMVVGLVAINVAGGAVAARVVGALPETSLGRTVGELDVAASDAYWGDLTEAAGAYDAETTVVLSTLGRQGTFRHLGYYLRDHRVYALGRDPDGEPGHLFTAIDGTTDYTVAAVDSPRPTLELPEGTRTVLVTDPSILDVLVDLDRQDDIDLAEGQRLVAVDAPADGTLTFDDPELDEND